MPKYKETIGELTRIINEKKISLEEARRELNNATRRLELATKDVLTQAQIDQTKNRLDNHKKARDEYLLWLEKGEIDGTPLSKRQIKETRSRLRKMEKNIRVLGEILNKSAARGELIEKLQNAVERARAKVQEGEDLVRDSENMKTEEEKGQKEYEENEQKIRQEKEAKRKAFEDLQKELQNENKSLAQTRRELEKAKKNALSKNQMDQLTKANNDIYTEILAVEEMLRKGIKGNFFADSRASRWEHTKKKLKRMYKDYAKYDAEWKKENAKADRIKELEIQLDGKKKQIAKVRKLAGLTELDPREKEADKERARRKLNKELNSLGKVAEKTRKELAKVQRNAIKEETFKKIKNDMEQAKQKVKELEGVLYDIDSVQNLDPQDRKNKKRDLKQAKKDYQAKLAIYQKANAKVEKLERLSSTLKEQESKIEDRKRQFKDQYEPAEKQEDDLIVEENLQNAENENGQYEDNDIQRQELQPEEKPLQLGQPVVENQQDITRQNINQNNLYPDLDAPLEAVNQNGEMQQQNMYNPGMQNMNGNGSQNVVNPNLPLKEQWTQMYNMYQKYTNDLRQMYQMYQTYPMYQGAKGVAQLETLNNVYQNGFNQMHQLASIYQVYGAGVYPNGLYSNNYNQDQMTAWRDELNKNYDYYQQAMDQMYRNFPINQNQQSMNQYYGNQQNPNQGYGNQQNLNQYYENQQNPVDENLENQNEKPNRSSTLTNVEEILEGAKNEAERENRKGLAAQNNISAQSSEKTQDNENIIQMSFNELNGNMTRAVPLTKRKESNENSKERGRNTIKDAIDRGKNTQYPTLQ